MAIEVRINGNGSYDGASTALSDYQYTEDSTPLDPNDTSGGVGQLQFTVIENASGQNGTLSLMNDVVTLGDGSNGTTVGTVSSISTTDGISTVSADSRLSLLLNPTTALPIQGTVLQVFTYYLSLANITSGIVFTAGTYLVDTNAILSYPGWTGSIWDALRAWAQSIGAEVSLVSNDVVLRPIRTRTVVAVNDSSISQSVQASSIAQTVQITQYSNTYSLNGLAYPDTNETDAPQVYTVDLNQTIVVNEPISATLRNVIQPTCVVNISPTDTGSEYTVIDNNGALIDPTAWRNGGGIITVKVAADGVSLDITIIGANLPKRAPFRIGKMSSDNDTDSTLRISGEGNFVHPTVITLWTGADPLKTVDVVGASVNNPFISTLDQVYRLGQITASQYCGPDQSITVSSANINRAGDSGNVTYPLFVDFNTGVNNKATVWNGKTFAQFDAAFAGQTFAQFDAQYFGYVQADFTNQIFGNVGGARRKYRDAWYRIDSGTVGPTGISYSASRDTTFGDFDTVWALTPFEGTGPNPKATAYTFADFDTINAGRTFSDFAMTPLWRTYAGYAANQSRQ